MHILWLKTELLHPIDKGGRIRTYHMLAAMKREHRVTYLSLSDGTESDADVRRASEYCDTLVRVPYRAPAKRSPAFWSDLARNAVSALPYAITRYRSPAMRERIAQLVRDTGVDLVVCDFLTPAVNVPDGLGVRTALFQHNVEAMIWERHAEVAGNAVSRAYMSEQARRMRRFEGEQCRRFDHVVAVSEQDADVMRQRYGITAVSAVPTGVDTDFFRPRGEARDGRDVVFVGSMDWMPNDDGAAWFVDQIWPAIRRAVPDATFTIVGRNPTPRVRELAERVPGLRVTGTVADVRPYLERAAAVVVPLRVGGGTRLKIYEALAMERPVVSTTIGAEGLPVRHGEHILLADDPDRFASEVVALLQNPARGDRLGAAAAAYVRAEFGWDRVAARFADVCAGVSLLPTPTLAAS